jgi:hypothetical protein
MEVFYLKEETYKIISLCMEVYKILSRDHSENVYGNALAYTFKSNRVYKREKKYNIKYNKEIILPVITSPTLLFMIKSF